MYKIACLSFLGFAAFLSAVIWTFNTANEPSPSFRAGDCITSNTEREAWQEPPTVMKIVEVGQKAYRVHIADDDGTCFEHNDTEPFTFDKYNKKVPCP